MTFLFLLVRTMKQQVVSLRKMTPMQIEGNDWNDHLLLNHFQLYYFLWILHFIYFIFSYLFLILRVLGLQNWTHLLSFFHWHTRFAWHLHYKIQGIKCMLVPIKSTQGACLFYVSPNKFTGYNLLKLLLN